MINIDKAIANLKTREKDLELYSSIMNMLPNADIANDQDGFQKKFNYFCRIRRNEAWRKVYYDLFSRLYGQEDVTFEQILSSIETSLERVEPSFSSKMLAAIRPDMPIWDSIVLRQLGSSPKYYPDRKKRMEQAIELYAKLDNWYRCFEKGPTGKAFVDAFDSAFPAYTSFSSTKKIDFIIWGSGDVDLFDGNQIFS